MRHCRAQVSKVETGSAAFEAGVKAGDIIEGVDGYAMLDILDWRELTSDCAFTLQLRRGDELLELDVVRKDRADLGIEFEEILFDGIKECANECLFCFVDQLPPGVRESLCIKDDDYRLSFLQGNFVTLTNCSQLSLARIIDFHMSPLYISVHATDPSVRNELLGRKKTKPIMQVLRFLAKGGIELHTQIVVVPGYNDGPVLERSINELASLFPSVLSIGIVPVGLTKHRSKKVSLRPVSTSEARDIIRIVEAYQAGYSNSIGTRLVWIADEYYLKAGFPFPLGSDYEEYFQLENGIGLAASLYDGIEALRGEQKWLRDAESVSDIIITGIDGHEVLVPILENLEGMYGKGPSLLKVTNDYFGDTVTVTGLLIASDISNAVIDAGRNANNTRRLVLPDICLRRGDSVLLDGLEPSDISRKTGIRVDVVKTGAQGFMDAAGLVLEGGKR